MPLLSRPHAQSTEEAPPVRGRPQASGALSAPVQLALSGILPARPAPEPPYGALAPGMAAFFCRAASPSTAWPPALSRAAASAVDALASGLRHGALHAHRRHMTRGTTMSVVSTQDQPNRVLGFRGVRSRRSPGPTGVDRRSTPDRPNIDMGRTHPVRTDGESTPKSIPDQPQTDPGRDRRRIGPGWTPRTDPKSTPPNRPKSRGEAI